MTAEKKKKLEEAGIDLGEALNRFMGDENLLERFLGKFLQDENFKKLTEAFENGDKEAALAASHTLKGVCGNLSMTALFDLLTEQVKKLREDDYNGAKEMMKDITEHYDRTLDAIKG